MRVTYCSFPCLITPSCINYVEMFELDGAVVIGKAKAVPQDIYGGAGGR
jgi:hypothetical protein